jgi:hypothetical protein
LLWVLQRKPGKPIKADQNDYSIFGGKLSLGGEGRHGAENKDDCNNPFHGMSYRGIRFKRFAVSAMIFWLIRKGSTCRLITAPNPGMGRKVSWLNDSGRWWEKDPVLVTSYSVLALETVYRGL